MLRELEAYPSGLALGRRTHASGIISRIGTLMRNVIEFSISLDIDILQTSSIICLIMCALEAERLKTLEF
jgi:hypothetical protein